MKVTVTPSALKQTKWYEYAIRFVFGGLVTVMAGLIAHKYGPAVGGLFLAFPAIFPASMTLVESHTRKKKEKQGVSGQEEGLKAASVDAAGAALGSLGLLAFAVIVWLFAARLAAWELLCLAALAWVIVSGLAWVVRQKI